MQIGDGGVVREEGEVQEAPASDGDRCVGGVAILRVASAPTLLEPSGAALTGRRQAPPLFEDDTEFAMFGFAC